MADIQDLGFETMEELTRLVSAVDLTHSQTARAFLEWKDKDGTKAGLERVLKIKDGNER